MSQGYFFKGKEKNYYYEVKKSVLYSYDRYMNGTEGEAYTEHLQENKLAYDDFIKRCISIEVTE